MREEGKIRAEAPMCAGDVRHRAFHAMIEQAVWRAQNDGLMQRDWRSGEYAHIQRGDEERDEVLVYGGK
jgi:hypothetical protein